METTNELSGALRGPDGLPLAGVEVRAVSLADEKSGAVRSFTSPAVTDDLGRFTFAGVRQGRYVLGVNVTVVKEPLPFPPTFYPGVESFSEAAVLTFAPGDRRDDLGFRIPRRLRERPATVRILWSDGTPAEGAFVQTEAEHLEMVTDSFRSVAGGRSTEDGRLDLVLFEGMRYRLRAYQRSAVAAAYRKPQGESQTIEVEPGDGPPELTFTLRRYVDGLCGAKEWIDP